MPYKTAHLYLNQGKSKFSQQCRGKLLCSPILWCCRTHYVQVSKAFTKVSWPCVCTHPTLRNAIFKLNYSQCITKASEPLMGGCFRDRVSPIFILSGIWDIFLVRPAICCVKMLPISLCCMKTAFHTALAVQALAVKVLSPTALLRSLTERWVVLPCRQFEGAAVFPADRDDRPETATASPSSPCTILMCKTAPLPSYSCSFFCTVVLSNNLTVLQYSILFDLFTMSKLKFMFFAWKMHKF